MVVKRFVRLDLNINVFWRVEMVRYFVYIIQVSAEWLNGKRVITDRLSSYVWLVTQVRFVHVEFGRYRYSFLDTTVHINTSAFVLVDDWRLFTDTSFVVLILDVGALLKLPICSWLSTNRYKCNSNVCFGSLLCKALGGFQSWLFLTSPHIILHHHGRELSKLIFLSSG